MIPVLYNHAEKDFLSNGLGRLTDCISCVVTEERNGVFTCEFEYPIFGRHYDEIAEGCIIFVTHDNSGVPQPFDVYRRSVPINGVVTFEAAHISYRLSNVVLKPFTATSCASALASIPDAAMNECEFQFATDKNVDSNFALTYPIQAKAILCGMEGSILDVYGTGEYKFDNFLVTLYLHRGVDTDVQIRYGKNLVDMIDERDSSESYNAVVPYWVSPDDGKVTTLPEYAVVATNAPGYWDYWTDDNGEYITDENDERFEFDYVALKPVTLDLSQVFETKPTNAQMRAKARQAADEHANPVRSISVDFVQLGQSEEYAEYAPLQQLNLCDTAEVIYNGESVRLKVVRTEYDVLRDRYSRIELGDPPDSYADVITGELNEKLKIVPSKSEMQAAITSATDKITGVQGGNVVIVQEDGKPQEILIMDTDDVETAVHVLRINMNGIGFSNTGVNGEYATAWTLDGEFVADFITAGTLKAELIKGGKLTAIDGNSNWDLNNSVFESISNNSRLRIVGGGLNFNLPDENNTKLLFFGPVSSSSGIPGVTLTARPGKALFLSYQNGNAAHYVAYIHDGSYGSYSDPFVVNDATRFKNDVHHNGESQFFYDDGVVGSIRTDRIGSNTGLFITAMGNSSCQNIILQARDYGSLSASLVENYATLLMGAGVYVENGLSAQSVTQRSDENLKYIRPYETAYDDVIDELEPISFRWKDGTDKCDHVGLGARKTKSILEKHGLTDAGFSRDVGGTYVMNYNELTVMLLKRVQDLTRRVEELEDMLCR